MSDIADIGQAIDDASKEKRAQLSDSRIEYAKKMLELSEIEFEYFDSDSIMVGGKFKVHFFPYSGWFQGKNMNGRAIRGRGIKNLLKQYRG